MLRLTRHIITLTLPLQSSPRPPSLFFPLSLSPSPLFQSLPRSPSLTRLLLSELSSPFHLFVGSNPPVLRFARPPTSPSPSHTGGNMAAPCTLDTLRLRCLITQDTSSRGNRACYRASPFSLFFFFASSPSYLSSLFFSRKPRFPSLPSDSRSSTLGRYGMER